MKTLQEVEAKLKSLHAKYDNTDSDIKQAISLLDQIPAEIKRYDRQKKLAKVVAADLELVRQWIASQLKMLEDIN